MKTTSAARILAPALLALALALPVLAAPLPSPAGLGSLLRPDPELARLASLPRPLSLEDYTDLALRASGVAEADLPARRAQVQRDLQGFADQGKRLARQGQAVLAEGALTYLHDKVFGHYEELATRVDQVLDKGSFNCVSSAVVYLLLLKSVGLEGRGVKTLDHAFVSLTLGGKTTDVETTNAYGFDPGTKKEFSSAFGRATGYRYVPPTSYADRTGIDEVQLCALILSNRIALLEESSRYAEALPLGADYAVLFGGAEGERLYLDCVDNLASAYGQAKDYAAMSALAEGAAAQVGAVPRLATLLETSAYNQAASTIARGEWRQGLALAQAALETGRIKRGTFESLVVYAYGSGAQALGGQGDWLGAARLAEEGAKLAGTDRSLVQAAKVYKKNFAAVSHNRFAELFNRRDYAGAIKVIEEALRLLPDDPDLLSDLALGKKAAGIKS